MIFENKIKIYISSIREQKKYSEKGYECNVKDTIEIDVLDLPTQSHTIIKVQCDYCGKIKDMKYNSYNRNTDNNKDLCCCDNIECMKKKRTSRINEKYGVDNVFQLQEIKDKMLVTNNEKYGCDNPQQNKEIKEKSEKTNFIKYGCVNVFQNDKIKEKSKQTCLEKYGVEYPQQCETIREKSRQTSINNFGVDYPNQNPTHYRNIEKKQFLVKKFRDTDLYYQASYEFDFLEKYYDRFKITRGPSIKYVYEEKECIYHPDFYLPEYDLIIEIKSSYWYNIHIDRCICKEKETKKFHNYLLLIDKDYKFLEDILK